MDQNTVATTTSGGNSVQEIAKVYGGMDPSITHRVNRKQQILLQMMLKRQEELRMEMIARSDRRKHGGDSSVMASHSHSTNHSSVDQDSNYTMLNEKRSSVSNQVLKFENHNYNSTISSAGSSQKRRGVASSSTATNAAEQQQPRSKSKQQSQHRKKSNRLKTTWPPPPPPPQSTNADHPSYSNSEQLSRASNDNESASRTVLASYIIPSREHSTPKHSSNHHQSASSSYNKNNHHKPNTTTSSSSSFNRSNNNRVAIIEASPGSASRAPRGFETNLVTQHPIQKYLEKFPDGSPEKRAISGLPIGTWNVKDIHYSKHAVKSREVLDDLHPKHRGGSGDEEKQQARVLYSGNRSSSAAVDHNRPKDANKVWNSQQQSAFQPVSQSRQRQQQRKPILMRNKNNYLGDNTGDANTHQNHPKPNAHQKPPTKSSVSSWKRPTKSDGTITTASQSQSQSHSHSHSHTQSAPFDEMHSVRSRLRSTKTKGRQHQDMNQNMNQNQNQNQAIHVHVLQQTSPPVHWDHHPPPAPPIIEQQQQHEYKHTNNPSSSAASNHPPLHHHHHQGSAAWKPPQQQYAAVEQAPLHAPNNKEDHSIPAKFVRGAAMERLIRARRQAEEEKEHEHERRQREEWILLKQMDPEKKKKVHHPPQQQEEEEIMEEIREVISQQEAEAVDYENDDDHQPPPHTAAATNYHGYTTTTTTTMEQAWGDDDDYDEEEDLPTTSFNHHRDHAAAAVLEGDDDDENAGSSPNVMADPLQPFSSSWTNFNFPGTFSAVEGPNPQQQQQQQQREQFVDDCCDNDTNEDGLFGCDDDDDDTNTVVSALTNPTFAGGIILCSHDNDNDDNDNDNAEQQQQNECNPHNFFLSNNFSSFSNMDMEMEEVMEDFHFPHELMEGGDQSYSSDEEAAHPYPNFQKSTNSNFKHYPCFNNNNNNNNNNNTNGEEEEEAKNPLMAMNRNMMSTALTEEEEERIQDRVVREFSLQFQKLQLEAAEMKDDLLRTSAATAGGGVEDRTVVVVDNNVVDPFDAAPTLRDDFDFDFDLERMRPVAKKPLVSARAAAAAPSVYPNKHNYKYNHNHKNGSLFVRGLQKEEMESHPDQMMWDVRPSPSSWDEFEHKVPPPNRHCPTPMEGVSYSKSTSEEKLAVVLPPSKSVTFDETVKNAAAAAPVVSSDAPAARRGRSKSSAMRNRRETQNTEAKCTDDVDDDVVVVVSRKNKGRGRRNIVSRAISTIKQRARSRSKERKGILRSSGNSAAMKQKEKQKQQRLAGEGSSDEYVFVKMRPKMAQKVSLLMQAFESDSD